MKKIWKIYGDESLKSDTHDSASQENAALYYDSPDVILNQYANQVYEDTEKQFNGIVTESSSGNTNEVSYALYIVAPKLKDYMYRLIEVNVPNKIQQYPLDVILFAKDPKNHRTFSCEGPAEFRKKLIELIESPVTRVILKHLKTLIEIHQQNVSKNYSFKLSKSHPSKTFLFKANSSPITIRKIILTSHLGKQPDEWGKVIANSYIKIISKNKTNGTTLEKIISLLQFLSLYQVQPVLELKLTLPDYDFYSQNNSLDSSLQLTLTSRNKDAQFEFFYEADEELILNINQ